MITNRHPADELAELRLCIRTLKRREEELRQMLLENRRDLVGDAHQVVLRRTPRRVFLKDRLPNHILSDPAYWQTRETTRVVVRDLSASPPFAQVVNLDDPVSYTRGPIG